MVLNASKFNHPTSLRFKGSILSQLIVPVTRILINQNENFHRWKSTTVKTVESDNEINEDFCIQKQSLEQKKTAKSDYNLNR